MDQSMPALIPVDLETPGQDRIQGSLHEGALQGPLRILDRDGNLLSESQYQAGQLEGECRLYADGQLLCIRHYQAGQLHGPSTTFEPSGEPSSRLLYQNGRLEGPACWMMAGVLIREGSFKSGLATGEWRHYGVDGALFESVNYQHGVADGVAHRYAPDGTVQAQCHYAQGKPLQPWTQAAAKAEPSVVRPGSRLERWIRG